MSNVLKLSINLQLNGRMHELDDRRSTIQRSKHFSVSASKNFCAYFWGRELLTP